MNLFYISDLEKFSGIKAHTIRIWEQRYNALNPHRTEGNTRYYDGNQLRRLLNIVSLSELNFKISDLCTMSDSELQNIIDLQINNDKTAENSPEYFVSQLISAGLNFDEPYFEKIFSTCILRYGMKDTYVKVIYPMLIRVGLLWATENMSTSNEHFISNLVRQKLSSAIDALPAAQSNKKTWLLFLPENEFHELPLLFSYYIIKLSGSKVIYLGANVPFDELIRTLKIVVPTHLLTFFVHHDELTTVQKSMNEIKENAGKSKLFVAGSHKLLDQLKFSKDIYWLKSANQLEEHI